MRNSPAASQASPQPPWILDAASDLILFVATPLLIVPLVWMARARWSVEDIALFVAAFGAVGHHLPGLLRAYGDRELFQRFKVRFIVAPLFLTVVCFWMSFYSPGSIKVMFVLWGLWHGLAQVYGFGRIYDAKVKSFSPWTARFDLTLCIAWFGLGIIWSSGRMYGLMSTLYNVGWPLAPIDAVRHFRLGWTVFTAVVTVGYLVHWAWQVRRGAPPSIIKLLLLATTFAFWWFAMVTIHNAILGIALFEIFHDVQYLAIVWVLNRRRVDKNVDVGPFTRMMFRRSGWMVGLYVGMVFAYGALSFARDVTEWDTLRKSVEAMLAISTFLHFYYDGFIWKVREKTMRADLGMEGGKVERPAGLWTIPPWMWHGLKWTAFVIPIGLSYWTYRPIVARQLAPPEQLQNLLAIAPDHPDALSRWAVHLLGEGRADEAQANWAAALHSDPQHVDANYNLGVLAIERQDFATAEKHLQLVVERMRAHTDARFNLAMVWARTGRTADAISMIQDLLQRNPRDVDCYNTLGAIECSRGNIGRGIEYFREALQIDPNFVKAHKNLARRLLETGDNDGAIEHFLRVVALAPQDAGAHHALGLLLVKRGELAGALAEFVSASRLAPQIAEPLAMRAWLLATADDANLRNPAAALELAQQAVAMTKRQDAEALDTLAAALAANGRYADAVTVAAEAEALCKHPQDAELLTQLRERKSLYASQRAYVTKGKQ